MEIMQLAGEETVAIGCCFGLLSQNSIFHGQFVNIKKSLIKLTTDPKVFMTY
jgi:hypothetical protein